MSDLSQRLQAAIADRYRIERTLGRGGMATVFLAEDLRHKRPVAIKVLDPEVAAAIGPERFLREIETVARLTHPHILPMFDSGDAGGLLYYVMPYVTGESLRARLEREKQLSLEDAVQIARELASALDHAHRQGVVHRDIKPENILLEAGHAVVADFGIARAVATAGNEKLTATGVAVGTPAYMSPEQTAGSRDVDGRCDEYALGCVLFEMLAGRPPFTGPTAQSLSHQHLNVTPRPVTELRTTVPAMVAGAIQKALAKTPADRYATAGEFARAVAGTPPHETPLPGSGARSGPRWRVGVALAIVIALAYVGLAVWQEWWPFAGQPAVPLAKKERILVAEFDGPPGDSTLAPAARSLLSAALDQSQIVMTVPQDAIQMALKAAGKPAGTRVDGALARELAYRHSVRTVLEGMIGRLGKGYTIVLSVVDVDTPRVILTKSGTAKDEDALIPALGEMAKQLRKGLGENRRALRATRSMALVATPSFDAYQLYVQGNLSYLRQVSNRDALRFDRAALALDPDFATAWVDAAYKYMNLGFQDSALTCLDEALRRPERLSLAQRLNAEQARAFAVGDFRNSAAAYDRILAENPENWRALAGSNDALLYLGRVEEALERTQKALRQSPPSPNKNWWRMNEVGDLLMLGRFDEAREADRQLTGIWKVILGADIELAAGRFALAESISTAHVSDAGITEDVPDAFQWEIAAARFGRGAVRDAGTKLREIDAIYRRVDNPPAKDSNRRIGIEFSVLSDGVMPLPPDDGGRDTSATALLTSGLKAAVVRDLDAARRCLAAARNRPPRELRENSASPVLLEARLEALAGRPQEAVRMLRPIGGPGWGLGVSLTWTHWWLADAFEQMARPDSAAFYLERDCSVAFMMSDGPEKPYVHRRLVMLYARMGRVADAERHLAEVEQAWDRPDPEIRRMLDEAHAAVRAARGMSPTEPPRKG